MRKFRIEVEGRIHEVNVEEIKASVETEEHIAVIAAAIACMDTENVVAEIASSWNRAGKLDLMTPVSVARKVPRWAKAVSSGWSLAGRKRLMSLIEVEGWHEEV